MLVGTAKAAPVSEVSPPDVVRKTTSATRPIYRPDLPLPPEGVFDFSLTELLMASKNASGVDYSPRARQLDGKMVRVSGYMVKQASPIPWAILMSPIPQSAHEREYFLCDDLPISTIHIFLPRTAPPVFPFQPGMIAMIGRLELGGRTEADERTSMARVFVPPGRSPLFIEVTNLVRVIEPVVLPLTNAPANSLLKP